MKTSRKSVKVYTDENGVKFFKVYNIYRVMKEGGIRYHMSYYDEKRADEHCEWCNNNLNEDESSYYVTGAIVICGYVNTEY